MGGPYGRTSLHKSSEWTWEFFAKKPEKLTRYQQIHCILNEHGHLSTNEIKAKMLAVEEWELCQLPNWENTLQHNLCQSRDFGIDKSVTPNRWWLTGTTEGVEHSVKKEVSSPVGRKARLASVAPYRSRSTRPTGHNGRVHQLERDSAEAETAFQSSPVTRHSSALSTPVLLATPLAASGPPLIPWKTRPDEQYTWDAMFLPERAHFLVLLHERMVQRKNRTFA